MPRWVTPLAAIGALAVLLVLPYVVGSFTVYLTMEILLLAIFALGFNLLLGYTGLLSFGQAGFFAIGAYACALILLTAPNLVFGIAGGVLAAGVVALVLGFLCVRLTEIYFAMLTLSFGMMIHSVIWRWRDVTGGDDGLTGIPRAPLEVLGLSIEVSALWQYYYFMVIVTAVAVWLMHRIVNSPLGLTFQAVRDSAVRAGFVGIPVRRFRLWAFVIAGLYSGLAGALLAPLERTVTPVYAHWLFSAEPILASLLGGIHTFAGPLVGAVLFIGIKEVAVRYTDYWMLFMGIVIIALVLGFRGGIVGTIQRWLRWD